MANVGYATLQIIPSAKGFTSALQGQVAPGMAAAGTASSQKFGGGFVAGFKGVLGPLAAVAGTTALAGFFKSAVDGASDLNETISKSSVIFGQAQKDIVKFAEDSSRNILLTKQEAIDAASTFGIFGKSAGLTGKDLSGFSTQLTSLASDLSSFYNTSTDDAITAIGAALRGESEPIRRYGVLLDEASLRAEALKQGLISTTKQALTPQQRVLAAQALILKQTSDAQGDAARTSDGLANQQRILRKNFNDIKVEVGQALLPAVNGLVHLLNAGLKPAFQGLKTVLAPIGTLFKSFGGSTDAAGKKVGALSGVLASLKTFFSAIVETLTPIGQQISSVVAPAFAAIANVIQTAVIPAIQAFLPAVQPVVTFLLKYIGGLLVNVIKAAVAIIKGAFEVISGILNVFAGLFTGNWSRLWQGVKQIFAGLWDAIFGILRGAIGIIGNIVGALFTAVIGIFKTGFELLFNAVKSGIVNTVSFFLSLPGKIIGAIAGLDRQLFNFGVNVIKGFINGIKSMASSIINAIKSTITDKLPGFVKSALGIQSPSRIFASIGENVGLGFIEGVMSTRQGMLDTVGGIADDIKKNGSTQLADAVKTAQAKLAGLQFATGSAIGASVVNSLPTSAVSTSATAANPTAKSGSNITINNYNPVAEPTSVTVSNTLTRLALIGEP